jgi:hypothetical protein
VCLTELNFRLSTVGLSVNALTRSILSYILSSNKKITTFIEVKLQSLMQIVCRKYCNIIFSYHFRRHILKSNVVVKWLVNLLAPCSGGS